jgi:agmatinase
VVFGIPFEKTSTFRHGADKAPAQIREGSWNFEQFDLRTGLLISNCRVHDAGDLEVGSLSSKQMFSAVKEYTASLLAAGKTPVALGGEHSVTPGIVHAFPSDIAVVSLDAHMDYRQSYKSDRYNHACAISRIADHVAVNHIAILGVRSAEKAEFDKAIADRLFFKDAFTIQKEGIADIIFHTRQYLGDRPVYLTIDIDAIDPAYAPGTSTPEPFGLTPQDVVAVIDAFAPSLVGFDIVEVCPPYDHGQTALLAAKLARLGIMAMSQERKGLP